MTDDEKKRYLEGILAQHSTIRETNQIIDENVDKIVWDLYKTADIAHDARKILNSIQYDFETKTSFQGCDYAFLFLAIGLQCVRYMIIDKYTKRKTDKESAEAAHKVQDEILGNAENNTSTSTLYHASRSDIIYTYKVPFDAIKGSKEWGVGGQNKGIGGVDHRLMTLGHDPLYGWIFGTSNIMTNTLTTTDMRSFHVDLDKFSVFGPASTSIMLGEFVSRSSKNIEDLAYSLIKEGIHLASDMYTKNGISLPGIQRWLSPEGAKQLSKYGIDLGNTVKIGAQAGLAILINQLIAMFHRLTAQPNEDDRLFEVRTRKILLYSNVISSTSNIIYVALKSFMQQSLAIESLDIGGLLVTIYRIATDPKIINEIREEYVFGKFDAMIRGEALNLTPIVMDS